MKEAYGFFCIGLGEDVLYCDLYNVYWHLESVARVFGEHLASA